jgi:hypothetical protein
MKVKELIEALQRMDQDIEVKLSVIAEVDADGGKWRTGGRTLKTVDQFDYSNGSIAFLAE